MSKEEPRTLVHFGSPVGTQYTPPEDETTEEKE